MDMIDVCQNRECERYGQPTNRVGYGQCEVCHHFVETFAVRKHCDTCTCTHYETASGHRLEEA